MLCFLVDWLLTGSLFLSISAASRLLFFPSQLILWQTSRVVAILKQDMLICGGSYNKILPTVKVLTQWRIFTTFIQVDSPVNFAFIQLDAH